MFKLPYNCTHLTCQQSNAENSPSQASTVHEPRTSRDQIAIICWIIIKTREYQRNIYLCFIDYTKALTVWITTNWKILQEMGLPDHGTCLLRNLCSQEATVSPGHGATDWFQTGKAVCQGCIFHPVYLTYIQSTSYEMHGWMRHKMKSRLLGEISITSDMQMTPPLWQQVKKN